MRTSVLMSSICLSWLFVYQASNVTGEESWQPLLSRAPADANALVMVQLDKVRNSEFAKTAGWTAKDSLAGGVQVLLPRGEIQRCLFAAQLNLLDLSPTWEVGVLDTSSDPSLELFAQGIHGPRETLGTVSAVRMPFDMYLVKLAPSLFGMMGPADRQKTARWGRQTSGNRPLDSAYLMKMASFPETIGTEIMIGFDLADTIDLTAARKKMSESPTIREGNIDVDVAAQILTSIEGVALGVRVLDQASAKLRVDFGRDPTPLTKVLKPLLLERLAARGAMIEDFNQWVAEIQGNTAFLTGKLSPLGLSRVLSIVEPTLPDSAAPTSTTPAASTPSGNVAQTTPQKTTPTLDSSPTSARPQPRADVTRQHFLKVRTLVTEIRFPSSDLKINSASGFGVWIDRQARRIDQLPMLDVDPDLLDWSQGVAKSLRVDAAKLRGASIRSSVYSSNPYAYNASGYAIQGGEYTGMSYQSPKQIQSRMETAAANLVHVDVMRMIDDEMASIRRLMTERFQVEF
jgi:hypothetical protein